MSTAGASPGGVPVLQVRDLWVTLPSESGPVPAVRGLSFDLDAGTTLAVVGESGAGKTVTALALLGLHPPSVRVAGSIRLSGQELVGASDAEFSRLRGNGISMVFQDPLSSLTPVYTVGDQLVEAIRAHQGLTRAAAWTRAVELLDVVGIPEPALRARNFPFEFSGGMRQRVLIAMAIANDPQVIVADEPTTALDVTIQAQVLDVLAEAQRATGAALVLITHDLGVVARMADQVCVLYAGRQVEQAAVDDLFQHPRMPYTAGLLRTVPRVDRPAVGLLPVLAGEPVSATELPVGCAFAPRCPLAVASCRSVDPTLQQVGPAADGHRAACHRLGETEAGFDQWFGAPASALPPIAPRAELSVLEVRGLRRHYPLLKGSVLRRRVGTVRAVDGIDLDIGTGQTLALVGESGCGKSTTVMEILSLARPQAGSIRILGQDVAGLDRAGRKALRRELQVVFQDPMAALDPRQPTFDIVAEPLRVQGYRGASLRQRVEEVLELVGVGAELAERYPRQLSGGQRQRVGIARALAVQPKLLVLDEPVSALDTSVRAGVINLLVRLQAELGLSYLFVSHDLAVVRCLADRVAVMYLGRIVEIAGVDELYSAALHPYTQALLAAVPIPDPLVERARRPEFLVGEPAPATVGTGCPFLSRCPRFIGLNPDQSQRCETEAPELLEAASGHRVACHFAAIDDPSRVTPDLTQ